MKKTIKYLVFSLFMLFGFSFNVNAETLPAAKDGKITLDKDYTIDSVTFDSTSNVSVLDLNGKTLILNGTLTLEKKFEIKNGTLLRNNTRTQGVLVRIGGISADVTFNNVIVDGNKVEVIGDANSMAVFSSDGSSLTINNSTFKNNYTRKSFGAAIRAMSSNSLIINDSKFENNKMLEQNYIGGVCVYAVTLNKLHINNTLFENNFSMDDGALRVEDIKDFVLDRDSILRNNTGTGVGGLHISDSSAVIAGTFDGNISTQDNGGALYTIFRNELYNERVIKITSTAKFINNKVEKGAGGAVYVNSLRDNVPGKVIIEGATFSGNKALGTVDSSGGLYKDIGGGAIAVARGILEINDIKMSGNTAAINKGNSIIVSHANGNANGGKLTINGGEFDNTIDLGVGSIVVNGGTFKYDMAKYITNKKLVSKKISNGYEVVENKVLSNDKVEFENEEAMENDYELVITDKSSLLKEDKIENNIKNVVTKEDKKAKDVKVLALYDISVSDGTNEIEMKDGKYKITINVDEKLLKYNAYAVVYVDDEGKVTYIPAKLDGNKVTFETSHLSTYGVVGYNIPNPATNSNVEVIVSIILFALMFVGMGISMKKQKINV